MTSLMRLTSEDIDDMARLHAAAFAKGEAWSEEAFADLLAQPSTYAAGLDEDGQMISVLIVQFVAGEADILTLATSPDHQRRGLAQNLIEQVEDQLLEKGLKKWLLDVAADNTKAISFYQKLGFECDGRRPSYYKRLEGVRVDAILMSKRLSRQAMT